MPQLRAEGDERWATAEQLNTDGNSDSFDWPPFSIGPSVRASLSQHRVANFEGSFATCGPINDNYWPCENNGPAKLADNDAQLHAVDYHLIFSAASTVETRFPHMHIAVCGHT
jgi:hypothetical protein